MAKSQFIYSKPESSRAIFKSKKNEKKTCKKHVPGIRMGIKIAQKWCIFHAKSSSCSHWKITTFHHCRHIDDLEKGSKLYFFHTKFICFLMKNHRFHRCRSMNELQEFTKIVYFSINNNYFSLKNRCFLFKNQCMYHCR